MKARKLADAHEKAARRVDELAPRALALEGFDDPADVSKLLKARSEYAAACAERDALAVALEGALRVERAEAEAQAARELEVRQRRDRVAAKAVGSETTEALTALGRLLSKHERLVDALPSTERYRFWPPTYCETASKQLATSAKLTREIDVRLTVPVGSSD